MEERVAERAVSVLIEATFSHHLPWVYHFKVDFHKIHNKSLRRHIRSVPGLLFPK